MSIQHESQREPVEYSSCWAHLCWVPSGKSISCCLCTFPRHWATNGNAVPIGILTLQFHFSTFIIVAVFGNLANLVQPRLHRLCGPIQDQLIESKVIINLFRCLSYLEISAIMTIHGYSYLFKPSSNITIRNCYKLEYFHHINFVPKATSQNPYGDVPLKIRYL